MLAIQKIPVTPGIPHHVICGDRGKAGHKDTTRPVMSDGVVPFWSSHMNAFPGRLVRPLAFAAACLSLPGCMVGPNYVPASPDMAADFQEADGATVKVPVSAGAGEVAWWHRFNDPQLVSLVERTVAANNDLEVAEARVRQSRSAREIARSLLYPRIGVGASALSFRGSEAAVGIPGMDLNSNLYQIGFDAEWALDVFGGTRRLVESAAAEEQGLEARRRGAVLMVVSETARAYVELRGAQRELQVARFTLADQRETLQVTEERHANGLSSKLELVRARTEVEATAAELPPIEQAIRGYIHVLSTLMASEPTALDGELAMPRPIPDVPDRIAVGVPSDLLRRRPDIQAAERHIAGATAQVGVATAALFPKMVLGASGGLSSRKSGDLFNDSSSRRIPSGTRSSASKW